MGSWPSYRYDLAGNSAWVTRITQVLIEEEIVLLELTQHIKRFEVTTRWVHYRSEYSTHGYNLSAKLYYTNKRLIWCKGSPPPFHEKKGDFYFIPYEIVEKITVTPADTLYIFSGLVNLVKGKMEVHVSALDINQITITCNNRYEINKVLKLFRAVLPNINIGKKWYVD